MLLKFTDVNSISNAFAIIEMLLVEQNLKIYEVKHVAILFFYTATSYVICK